MKERKKFELIRKISEIVLELIPYRNVLATIVDLKLPQKGGILKVYLSIYPEDKAKEIIKYLNSFSKEIKNEIKNRVYLRHLPSRVIFYSTNEFVYAQNVLELINEAQKKETKRTED